MIDVSSLSGSSVPIMGLGKSGMSTARALMRSGAKVWAWDDAPARRAEAEAAGIPVIDLMSRNLGEAALIVWSPGIPHAHPKPHPLALRAREARLEIVCDVELLGRSQPNATYIGVTGTNGKSTTTALVGHILKSAGRRVQVGGNLGTPVLDLEPLASDGVYVLEMSSYQLELTPSLVFDVAVLTNFSPDHLARHGGMEGYIEAKRHIFHGQGDDCTAVVGIDDEPSRRVFDMLENAGRQIRVPVSAERRAAHGVSALNGRLIDDMKGQAADVADLASVASLPGQHNWQNAAAAYAAARAVKIAPAVIAAALRTFPGLAHRQELIAIIDGVRYVNDSKATNADAAEKAIVCYEHIYWIAGGQAKEGGIASLAPHFGRIVHAYLIGEAAKAFAESLEGVVPYTLCGTLETAVKLASKAAARDAAPDVVVLLSPACASWDQFANFEARGDAFRALVAALPGEHSDAHANEVAS